MTTTKDTEKEKREDPQFETNSTDADRVIQSLRDLADELERGDARLEDYNLEQLWGSNAPLGDTLSHKHVSLEVSYDNG